MTQDRHIYTFFKMYFQSAFCSFKQPIFLYDQTRKISYLSLGSNNKDQLSSCRIKKKKDQLSSSRIKQKRSVIFLQDQTRKISYLSARPNKKDQMKWKEQSQCCQTSLTSSCVSSCVTCMPCSDNFTHIKCPQFLPAVQTGVSDHAFHVVMVVILLSSLVCGLSFHEHSQHLHELPAEHTLHLYLQIC